jgi:hypothetical protein
MPLNSLENIFLVKYTLKNILKYKFILNACFEVYIFNEIIFYYIRHMFKYILNFTLCMRSVLQSITQISLTKFKNYFKVTLADDSMCECPSVGIVLAVNHTVKQKCSSAS